MSQEVQGSLVVMWVSPTNSNFKAIVCEDQSQASATANVNTTKTKCGTFTAVDTPENTLSGSGIADASPAANQCTYKDLDGWLNSKTKLYFIYQNLADTTAGITKGSVVYKDGQGYFTEVSVTAQEGDLVKFNWSFATTGAIDNSADS
jgi:hypothetical protein